MGQSNACPITGKINSVLNGPPLYCSMDSCWNAEITSGCEWRVQKVKITVTSHRSSLSNCERKKNTNEDFPTSVHVCARVFMCACGCVCVRVWLCVCVCVRACVRSPTCVVAVEVVLLLDPHICWNCTLISAKVSMMTAMKTFWGKREWEREWVRETGRERAIRESNRERGRDIKYVWHRGMDKVIERKKK